MRPSKLVENRHGEENWKKKQQKLKLAYVKSSVGIKQTDFSLARATIGKMFCVYIISRVVHSDLYMLRQVPSARYHS